MTALAGLWRLDNRTDAADGCKRMLASQKLYGPDAVAQWSSGDFAVGRSLMRLLPEDAYDRQPLTGGDGRYILVADIRLDNRDDLVGTLQIPTPAARMLSDAGILMSAIERWGLACFQHLVGDYAFALWDISERQLVLARDPFGRRPLHYHRGHGFFAFASMPKGLHALAEVGYAPDEDYAAADLALVPELGSRTFFEGIERVEPAHFATVTAHGFKTQRHWQPTRRILNLKRPEDYAEALREHLDRAVNCQLRGTGDIGSHLSGGLDSSAVTATAAKLLAPTDRKIFAFSGVPHEGYQGRQTRRYFWDAKSYAEATAALYPNVDHVFVRTSERSPFADLDKNFYLYDRPVHNIDNIGWVHSIRDAARERNVRIMLTGMAGNMGLSYNGMEALPELFRTGRWLRLLHLSRALVAHQKWRWRGVLVATLGAWCPAYLWVLLYRLAGLADPREFDYTAINPRRSAELDLLKRGRDAGLDLYSRPWKDGFDARLWMLSRVDEGNYYKAAIGGWQIDERDPTSDLRLIEFCMSVPTEQFFMNGVTRSLARHALADRLPRMVLDERRMGEQAPDWYEALKPARSQLLSELDRLEACGPAVRAIDMPRLRRLASNWPADSSWETDEAVKDYRVALLRAISTGHFLRRVTASNN